MDNENQIPSQPPTPPTPPTTPPVVPPTPPVTPPTPPTPPTPSTAASTPTITLSPDANNKIFAALSYVSLLFLIPLIGKHKDANVMFHAKQGMVLFVAEVIVWFVLLILEMILIGSMGIFGVSIFYGISGLFWLIPLVLSLMGIYYVFQDKQWVMPIIGNIAKKIQL